jgi:hypothetical protein
VDATLGCRAAGPKDGWREWFTARSSMRGEEVRVMQPSGDEQANAETADAPASTQVHTLVVQDVSQAQTVETVSIAIRTHLWIAWARIALKHEATAHATRQEMQRPGADHYRLLLQEADAGLDGICAAAFALEALSRELSELGAIPEATLKAWRDANKRPKAKNVIPEVLAQTIDTRGLYTRWRAELAWLFDLRDCSVHYEGAFAPSKPHPLGMTVAPEQVAYLAENVRRAVELLLGILERCRDKPKPPARDWSRGMRGAVDELVGRRGRAA